MEVRESELQSEILIRKWRVDWD